MRAAHSNLQRQNTVYSHKKYVILQHLLLMRLIIDTRWAKLLRLLIRRNSSIRHTPWERLSMIPQCVLRFVHIVDVRTFHVINALLPTVACFVDPRFSVLQRAIPHATVGNNALMTSERTRIDDMHES